MLDIRPARPQEDSGTVQKANDWKLWNRIYYALLAGAELGIFLMAPQEYKALAELLMMVIALIAIAVGDEQRGMGLILERIKKPDIVASGKVGFLPLKGKVGVTADKVKSVAYLAPNAVKLLRDHEAELEYPQKAPEEFYRG